MTLPEKGTKRSLPKFPISEKAPNAPRHHTERSRVRDDDEQTAFDSYMNPEAGFINGPGFQGP